VIVAEADDATDRIEQNHTGNAARLGASGRDEVGDRRRDEIGA
jgi:hypothetical protein